MQRRILFVSTPVSPIGSGEGGGVETTLIHLAPALVSRGHKVAIIAPAVSVEPAGVGVFQVRGESPPSVTTANRTSTIVTAGYGVLEAMWDCAREVQHDFDVIVGMTYDWLSYFLTPFFQIPVVHWITISSAVDVVDRIIAERFRDRVDALAFYSRTQAETFKDLPITKPNVLPGAVDIGQFSYSATPANRLSWAARISREKGLEDAIYVAHRTGLPLDVCGLMQDRSYWEEAISSHRDAQVTWHGMLPHSGLAKVLGNSVAMLATPKWTEAFGLTLVEALACGTPVVAYARGGPAEIVESGRSGYLVPADDTEAMVDAVSRLPELNRADARARSEEYTIPVLITHFEGWIERNLGKP